MEIVAIDSSNCILVQYQGLHILFDYFHDTTLDNDDDPPPSTTSSILGFDPASIDVVLISNHESLPSLVHLCEYTTFNGVVIATQATVLLGRGVLENCECKPNDIVQCLSKIKSVSYGEDVSLSSLSSSLSVCAVSSGYTLGACNWILKALDHRVCVLGASAMVPERYPSPMKITALCNANTLIVRGSTVSQAQPHRPFQRQLHDLRQLIAHECHAITATTAGKPSPPVLIHMKWCTGLVYDVLLTLSTMTTTTNNNLWFMAAGGGDGSNVAKESLTYANALPEWMCAARQATVFQGTLPLDFTNVTPVPISTALSATFGLVANSVMVVAATNNDGVAALKAKYQPAVITLDPPYLDVRLSGDELMKLLLQQLKPPQQVFITGNNTLPTTTTTATTATTTTSTTFIQLQPHQPYRVRAPTYETAVIDETLVAHNMTVNSTIVTTHSGRHFRCARVRGHLERHDHVFRVTQLLPEEQQRQQHGQRCWGTMNIAELVLALQRYGYPDACVRQRATTTTTPSPHRVVIDIPTAGDARIRIISPQHSRIVCSQPEHRARIQQVLTTVLQTI